MADQPAPSPSLRDEFRHLMDGSVCQADATPAQKKAFRDRQNAVQGQCIRRSRIQTPAGVPPSAEGTPVPEGMNVFPVTAKPQGRSCRTVPKVSRSAVKGPRWRSNIRRKAISLFLSAGEAFEACPSLTSRMLVIVVL